MNKFKNVYFETLSTDELGRWALKFYYKEIEIATISGSDYTETLETRRAGTVNYFLVILNFPSINNYSKFTNLELSKTHLKKEFELFREKIL